MAMIGTMQVAPSGGCICKLVHVATKFGANASGATWWLNLEHIARGTTESLTLISLTESF